MHLCRDLKTEDDLTILDPYLVRDRSVSRPERLIFYGRESNEEMMCPLHRQSNCNYVFMNQVHGRKRDDFSRFLLSIALVLAYVQAVGALRGVIDFFFPASPRYPQTCCLDSAATIGLYRLDCIIKSAFSVWVGILIDRACLDRTRQQERGDLYISPQPTGTRTERFPPISLFFQGNIPNGLA